MNKHLSPIARALPAALVFAAAAALSTGAHADAVSKKALAVKLAQLQQKNDGGALSGQLTQIALQPMLAKWGQEVQTRVPASKQKDVSDKLNAELKKFGDNTHQAIEAQLAQTAQDALVPVFIDKLSEPELKTIVTYLQSPASAKFAALGTDAGNAWAKKIVENTQTAVQGYTKTFDDAAQKIVNAAANKAPAAPAGSQGDAAKAPAAAAAPANSQGDAANAPAESASSASDAQ